MKHLVIATLGKVLAEHDGVDALWFAGSAEASAMVAAAGWWRLQREGPSPLDTGANPSLGLSA